MIFKIIYVIFCLHTFQGTCQPAECNLSSQSYPTIFESIEKEENDTILNGLINCTADRLLDIRNENGDSPLFLAAKFAKSSAFKSLLSRNVSFTHVNHHGENILHASVIGGDLEILATVLDKNEINLISQDYEGNTVLHYITIGLNNDSVVKIKKNIVQVCERLLEDGAIPNLKNNEHLTPFHIALKYCNQTFTRDILETFMMKQQEGHDIQDRKGRTPLQISLDYDCKNVFDLFINFSVNPYYVDLNGRTVIHNAVLKNAIDYLNVVLDPSKKYRGEYNVVIPSKVGLNIQDIYGYTPLHWAAEKGFESAFDALFDQLELMAVDPISVNRLNESTLFSAVKGGVYSIVEKLVNVTKDKYLLQCRFIDFQNNEGTTALHLAVETGSYELVELLRRNGANIEIEDKNEHTVVDLAASWAPLRTVKLLTISDDNVLRHLALSVSNGNYEEVIEYFLNDTSLANVSTPLQLAVARGDDMAIKNYSVKEFVTSTLYKNKFSHVLNDITNDHKVMLTELAQEDEYESMLKPTLLNIALFFQGKPSTIDILPAQCEDPNAIWSPVSIAAFRNKVDIVEHFLKKNGSLCNQTDIIEQTFMHKAAWGGSSDVIEYLYERCNDTHLLNKRDKIRRTPLHIAAMRGFNRTVACLLEHNIEALNARDKYSFTPLHLAEIYGHHKFFIHLQYASITLPASERYKTKFPGLKNRLRNHTATIEILLKKGADPNAQDSAFGWTALHWAAANGDLKVVKMLIENHAKVSIPSNSGQTPLYLARFWGRAPVYEYLRDKGAVW